jgi:osmotically-inducible protein OsmY
MRGLKAPVALLAVTLAAAACGPTDRQNETVTGDPAPVARNDARNDATLRTEISAKYYANDSTRGQRLDVNVDQGVATVRGVVPDEMAEKRAIELADSVEGVTRVNDEITVRAPEQAKAPERDDSSPALITATIQAKYFGDPDVKGRTIDVTTAPGGLVTLEGTVETQQEQAEAVRLARETDGVTRVDSRLRVQPNAPREQERRTAADPDGQSDTWLTTKIQAKYFMDADVRGRNIDVETRDGIVTLTGVVGSEAERRQAIALARNTDGVREVTDKLRIEMADAKARPGTTVDVNRPDPWITMKIQAQYFLDSEVKGHEIDVDTTKGIVTLTGAVETAQQKQEAELIAKETEGVKQVVNRLKVAAE